MSNTLTITEALADIKTIGKRIDTQKQFIASYMFRQECVKDPLEKNGGTEVAIASAFQAIADLNERLISLRIAIQTSNLYAHLTVLNKTRTVAEWLTWRKEVAPGRQALLLALRKAIDKNREELRKKGSTLATATASGLKEEDFIVGTDEMQLNRDIEELENILGTLDGKLSLNNATTHISI